MALALLSLLTAPLLLISLWLYTAFISTTFPTLRNKRILLLIAHPDDEAMFFGPTVTRLANPSLGNQLKIFCLSTGTAGGVGEVRKKELEKSAVYLGLRKEDVIVLDDPSLQDSAHWSPTYIATLLQTNLAPTLSKTPTSKAATAAIDILLTFDTTGVSSHHNHTACHTASKLFLTTLTTNRSGWDSPITFYTLSSVNILRKYSGVIDCLFTVLSVMFALGKVSFMRQKQARAGLRERDLPPVLFCVAGLGEWWQGLRAMVRGHWSQMLWFRWGWVGLGRFMVVNDLRRLKA